MNSNSSEPQPTIDSWLEAAAARLGQAGIDSGRLDSQLLLAHVLNRDRTWLLAHPEQALTEQQLAALEILIAKRVQRQPLAHLTNSRQFYGLDLYVDDNVLTPRVETEQLAAWAIQYARPDSRLIDIGTGSGAIALAIKYHRPDLEVWATDITEAALAVAQRNAASLKLDIKLLQSDLFDALQGQPLANRFGTVVANLPYLADAAKSELMPEVGYEPDIALFGGSDGLDLYRRLLAQLPAYLEPSGYLFTECDPWQQPGLIALAKQLGLKIIEQDSFILGFRKL